MSLTLCVQDYVSRLANVSCPSIGCASFASCLSEMLCRRDTSGVTDIQQFDRFNQLFTRCEHGEPLAYVLGEWEFWGLTLKLQGF